MLAWQDKSSSFLARGFLRWIELLLKNRIMIENKEEQKYWSKRYEENRTGWDIGYPSTPLKEYIDQLTDKTISILIPGAGNAYEAIYLFEQGFENVFIMDISKIPLENFQNQNPSFPKEQLLHEDFF